MSLRSRLVLCRRHFVQGSVAGPASIAFSALSSCSAEGHGIGRYFSPDYGPLSPKPDMTTGLKLLSLPDGFKYMSYGWTGQVMDDGRPTPTDHDGMGVVARRGPLIALVRNHELDTLRGSRVRCEMAL